MKTLWALFIVLQILSAGHINYQQEAGYYEINPIYGKHLSKEKVYIIKGLETLSIYGATKIFPKYKKHILISASNVCIGFMAYDKTKGILLKFRF